MESRLTAQSVWEVLGGMEGLSKKEKEFLDMETGYGWLEGEEYEGTKQQWEKI